MLVWYCREGSFSWHILRVTLYALSFEHLWIACWRSGNRVSRPLFWWCIRVFPFVYFNFILKFWHAEEQMQQRAISYLIRGAFRVTTDGKVLLQSTIWKKVRPILQQRRGSGLLWLSADILLLKCLNFLDNCTCSGTFGTKWSGKWNWSSANCLAKVGTLFTEFECLDLAALSIFDPDEIDSQWAWTMLVMTEQLTGISM